MFPKSIISPICGVRRNRVYYLILAPSRNLRQRDTSICPHMTWNTFGGTCQIPSRRSLSGRREICRNPHFVSRSRNPWISSKPNGKQENPDVAWLLWFFSLPSFSEMEQTELGTWNMAGGKGEKVGIRSCILWEKNIFTIWTRVAGAQCCSMEHLPQSWNMLFRERSGPQLEYGT